MIIDIFIRTYPKDYHLLQYCLYSIKKNVKGYRDIIICVREKDYDSLVNTINTSGCKIIQCHNFQDEIDYCGQQISKINADKSSDSDYILYIDSDCIVYDIFDIQKDLFDSNGKMFFLKDKWDDIPKSASCWKPCLEALDILTQYEFMRRIPFIVPTRILKPVRELIELKTQKEFADGCLYIYNKLQFSEFNIMGSYMYLNDNTDINFVYSKDAPKVPLKQLWSHTNKIHMYNEIKQLLKFNDDK